MKSELAEYSVDLSLRIVAFYQWLTDVRHEYVMSKQILRSGTSIGANIHEGIQAQSKADFVSKLGISLKEASETSYWLVVLYKAGTLEETIYNSVKLDLDEIIRILIYNLNLLFIYSAGS